MLLFPKKGERTTWEAAGLQQRVLDAHGGQLVPPLPFFGWRESHSHA